MSSTINEDGYIYRGFYDDEFSLDNPSTKLGLNLFGQLDSDWQVSAQIVARNHQEGFFTHVDWVFATYQPVEEISVRIGRQIPPTWMFSESIDVGLSHPWIRPPEEVYSLNPLKAVSGASVTYTHELSDSELALAVYAGNTREEYRASRDLKLTILAKDYKAIEITWLGDDFKLRANHTQAEIEIPLYDVDDHGVGFSSVGFDVHLGPFWVLGEYVEMSERLNDDKRAAASAQAASLEQLYLQRAAAAGNPADAENFDPIQAQVYQEYARLFESIREFNSLPFLDASAYYLTLAYTFAGAWMPSLTYATVDGKDETAFGFDQSSVTATLKYNFNPNISVKAEHKMITLPDDSPGLFSNEADGTNSVIGEDEFTFTSIGIDAVF